MTTLVPPPPQYVRQGESIRWAVGTPEGPALADVDGEGAAGAEQRRGLIINGAGLVPVKPAGMVARHAERDRAPSDGLSYVRAVDRWRDNAVAGVGL